MFVDADANKDGLVDKYGFSKLVDNAAAIPRLYGYAPPDAEVYPTAKAKELARLANFHSFKNYL